MRPWVVAFELEVFVFEAEEVFHIRVQLHLGQRSRSAGQLQPCLFDVVEIEVGVAGGMDEVARLESCHLCHHEQQQGIRGDVERHSEESVGAALV